METIKVPSGLSPLGFVVLDKVAVEANPSKYAKFTGFVPDPNLDLILQDEGVGHEDDSEG